MNTFVSMIPNYFKIFCCSLIFSLSLFELKAQKDTAFVAGDTLYTYRYSKKGKLSMISKCPRGRDSETYFNWISFDEAGEISSVVLEDKLSSNYHCFYKNDFSYTIDKNGYKGFKYDKSGAVIEKGYEPPSRTYRITEKYKSGILVSTDTTIIKKHERKNPKVWRLKVDTIVVNYPKLTYDQKVKCYTTDQGIWVRNPAWFADSLARDAVKNTSGIYYLESNGSFFPHLNSGLYRKGFIPYN